MPEALIDAKLTAKQRKDLPASQFALPSKRMFPIHDKDHIEQAWRMVPRAKGISASERATARKNILKAAKEMGMDTSDWEKKAMTDAAVEVFTDMVITTPAILDATEDGKMRLRFKVTEANVVNTNRRLYPDPILDSGLEAGNERIAQNRMVGESPHPKHMVAKDGSVVFDTSIDRSVVKWTGHFKQDGVVYADCVVLDTTLGRDLKALVDAGVPVGVSMRALGDSVRKQIGGVMVDVATKLDIQSYDIVMNPATKGCEVVQVLTDSQVTQAMTDAVNIETPPCPACGGHMEPMDPDNDGDLDFYGCQECGSAWIPEESQTQVNQATQRLTSLPNDPDWDGWSLARNWQMAQNKPGAVTDAKEEDDQVDIKELMQAVLDSPEFAAAVEAKAEEKARAIAQPALDSVQAQKDAEAAAARKAEVKTFVDSKIAELKEKKFDASVIQVITDKTEGIEDKTTAEAIVDSIIEVYSKASTKPMLDAVGFTGASQEGGQVRVEVTHEPKPWEGQVKSFLDSMDRIAFEQGHEIRQDIRKVNRPIIDEIIGKFEQQVGYEAIKDSAAFLDSTVVNTDSVSVTTGQLLNQPTIQQILLIESFQDVESLQFLATETFEGDEVRWPVETFSSAATIDPTTGTADLLVSEGTGIPESTINLGWLTFNPSWRRNAISLTTDVIKTLKSGPARYDAVSRALYNISYDKRRKLDNYAYLEMLMAADEYQPKVVANETIAAAQISAGASGTNVAYVGQLTLGGTATSTAGSNPIVRPRTKKQHLPSGQVQTVTSNAFSITVSGSAITQGYLDASGNVQGGDFAVDWENGNVYFKSSAGLNPSGSPAVLPVVSYSGMTNYVRWSYTNPNASTFTDAEYYNTLLQLLTTQVRLMGSAPRFQRPNLAIMSENISAYIENATMWYKLNSPDIGNLAGLAEGTFFGNRSNVALARINAPWAAGDGRILLTQKGATRYAIETAYQVKGPYPKYDTNQQIMDADLYYGSENSVMATPQVVDTTGAIINPKSRSIKIVS